jgi:hypothetical protein
MRCVTQASSALWGLEVVRPHWVRRSASHCGRHTPHESTAAFIGVAVVAGDPAGPGYPAIRAHHVS